MLRYIALFVVTLPDAWRSRSTPTLPSGAAIAYGWRDTLIGVKRRHLRRLPLTAVGVLTLVSASIAPGIEKYAIVAQADAVVFGQMHLRNRYPWFDGWHFSGEIQVAEVAEVLWSKRSIGSTIPFQFVCSCCSLWPPPDL